MIDWQRIADYVEDQFTLGKITLHGPDHWQRVEAFGLALAPVTGADVELVRLFALLHDGWRHHEGHDPDHGRRAAEQVASTLQGRFFTLPPLRLALLTEALEDHPFGHLHTDPTIGTCWDADRLDLGRAGVGVSAPYLSTAAARREVGSR